MRCRLATLALLMALPWSDAARSAEPLTTHTLRLAPGEAGTPVELCDFAWLAGRWGGTGLDGVNEEYWSAPAAGSMMGMYRMIRGGKVIFYELLTLTTSGLTLRHFHDDLKGWEERDETVRMPFIAARDGLYQFAGLTFAPRPDGTLLVHVAIEKPGGAAPTEATFHYRRLDRLAVGHDDIHADPCHGDQASPGFPMNSVPDLTNEMGLPKGS